MYSGDSCATRAASVNSTLTSSITLPNVHPPPLTKKNSAGSGLGPTSITLPKYLWIRLALFEKLLAVIIDHLVQNCRSITKLFYCIKKLLLNI